MNLHTVKWAQSDKTNTENCKHGSSKCAYYDCTTSLHNTMHIPEQVDTVY